MKTKPYKSEAYLRLMYVEKGLSIDEIAEMCGVSHNTIRSELNKRKLIR